MSSSTGCYPAEESLGAGIGQKSLSLGGLALLTQSRGSGSGFLSSRPSVASGVHQSRHECLQGLIKAFLYSASNLINGASYHAHHVTNRSKHMQDRMYTMFVDGDI